MHKRRCDAFYCLSRGVFKKITWASLSHSLCVYLQTTNNKHSRKINITQIFLFNSCDDELNPPFFLSCCVASTDSCQLFLMCLSLASRNLHKCVDNLKPQQREKIKNNLQLDAELNEGQIYISRINHHHHDEKKSSSSSSSIFFCMPPTINVSTLVIHPTRWA